MGESGAIGRVQTGRFGSSQLLSQQPGRVLGPGRGGNQDHLCIAGEAEGADPLQGRELLTLQFNSDRMHAHRLATLRTFYKKIIANRLGPFIII